MASFNKVILLGNLTRDPEVRYTPKGSAVCDLGIAVNRVYTTDSGEKREEVTYVDVVLWARLAEIAGEYLKKGRPVFIEGRLQMDTLGRQANWAETNQTAGRRREYAVARQPSRRSRRCCRDRRRRSTNERGWQNQRAPTESRLRQPSPTTTKFPSDFQWGETPSSRRI